MTAVQFCGLTVRGMTMAHLMIVQCSGRRNGYTANLMKAAVKCIGDMENLEVEVFHLHDYMFGPCTSCFSCIRNVGSGCVLDDDWGRKREGVLYKAAVKTNGVLMVDPVHGWGMSAAARLFLERFYPTFWEGIPYGMPFASISCASNQGFQYRASEEYCKFAAAHGLLHAGSLPVHALFYDEGLARSEELAVKIAEAALADEKNGRKKPTDKEIFTTFNGTAFDLVEKYFQNLTDNTFVYEESLPYKAVRDGLVTNPEALPLIEKVCEHLKTALELYHAGNRADCAVELSYAAKYWTNGTFKQCCENVIVKAGIPKAYRPLDE